MLKTIIVGTGRLARSLARRLAEAGHQVAIIASTPSVQKLPAQVIQGVGFDLETLEQAGVRETQLLIAVADSENTNLVSAQVAKLHFQVPRVVARVEDPQKADFYRQQGFEVFCPIRLGLARVEELLASGTHREEK